MTLSTFVPVLVTLAVALPLGWRTPGLHPAWSARLYAIVAATTAVAALGTVACVGVNYLAGLAPEYTAWLPEWALFGDDRPLPAALGLPALALTVAGGAVAGRLAVRWSLDLRAARADARGLLATDVPIAVAVPGRYGGVVVSRGLLDLLTREELRVVFEHERAHLRHRHHLYLGAATLASGVVPLLRPLERRLRFAVERWADEDAAEAVGDRRLVARTLARVALTGPPGPLPAFTDGGVAQRVAALLAGAPAKSTFSGPIIVVGAGATTAAMASSALQIDRAIGLMLP